MRTFLISLLLAGVASPTLAAAPDREPRDRSERAEAKAERKAERQPQEPRRSAEPGIVEGAAPQRSFAPRSLEGPGAAPSVERRNVERTLRNRGFEAASVDDGPEHRSSVRQVRRFDSDSSLTPAADIEQSADDGVRELRRGNRARRNSPATIDERNLRNAPGIGESGDLVQQKRELPRVLERAERRVSRKPILGTEPPPPRTATAIAAKPARHWRTDWRNDRRYDWRDWRRRHRSRFHFGFYNDPFGWSYFRYGVGWRLWPSYYRSSYWLRDPWEYRLPPAYGPYRWVRYYDDALLVNIYTGQVVDVVYNFFW